MLRIKIRKPAAVLVLLLTLLFAVNARAEELVYDGGNGYRAVIRDDADKFTDAEEMKLMDLLKGALQYGNAAIVTIDENYTSTESYAESAYRDYFGWESGTLFLIDMDNRYLQFFSDGSNYSVLTTSKTNEISDNIYSYASEGDYYGCAYKGFEQVITVLSGGRIVTPMRYVTSAILAFGVALLVNIWLVVRQRKKQDPSKIVDTFGKIHRGAVRHVTTTMTNQRRTRHVESSGGGRIGGGGGFGGGGGGGHSGGGGGHSF